jgi:hypothetical protein
MAKPMALKGWREDKSLSSETVCGILTDKSTDKSTRERANGTHYRNEIA